MSGVRGYELSCDDCDYVVKVEGAPERCPECQGVLVPLVQLDLEQSQALRTLLDRAKEVK